MHHADKFFSAFFKRNTLSLALALTFVVSLASCKGKQLEERRYDLKGTVVSVDRVKGSLTLDHEKIEGLMPAMRMPFPLHDVEVLKEVDGGDLVQATLVVTDEGYRLENIFLTQGQPGLAPAPHTQGLGEPQPGAEIPDVKLVNQDGRKLNTGGLRGRALVVTFIYTRCPLSDQCPLMSANFAQLNAELAKDTDTRKRTRLLSVTLDPEFDKPEVLKRYGTAYAGGNFDNWDFATGDPKEVRRFAEFFGLMYKAESDQVIHSLRTALVLPNGKLYKLYRGNEWKPEDILQDLRAILSGWGDDK